VSNQAKYPKPVVGQVVWVEIERNRKPAGEEATVTKVGRKWADVSGGHGRRFDIETWDLDGGRYSSPGNVYPCRDAREKEISRIRAWRNLSDAIDRYRYSAPPNVTIETIQQAAELLGLEVKPS